MLGNICLRTRQNLYNYLAAHKSKDSANSAIGIRERLAGLLPRQLVRDKLWSLIERGRFEVDATTAKHCLLIVT
jgi:hypothetical protein